MATHKNSQETIDKIIRAARRLFARKGYANAGLEEIAKLAGFTKGAVYHFFRSKQALLLALLQDIEERSVAQTARELASAVDVPAMDKLVRFNSLQARWAERNPDDLAVLMWVSIESANSKSAVREQVGRIYGRIDETLTRIVEEGKTTGEFPADLPVKDTVTWITAIHDGNMLLWYRSGRDKAVGHSLTQASAQAMRMAVRLHEKASPPPLDGLPA